MADEDIVERRGRPRLVPGEPSIQVFFSIEQSAHRRLCRLAQQERIDLTELLRVAAREFLHKKLSTSPRASTL
jgi:hypothetical protein